MDDLVRETCGFVSPNNVKVFEAAVLDQGGTVGLDGRFSVDSAFTLIPTCLPDEREFRLVGRLPSAGDTLSQFFETDADGGFYRARANETGQFPGMGSDPEFDIGQNVDRVEALARFGVPVDPFVTTTEIMNAGANITNATSDYFRDLNVNPNDRSRVAYETFAITSALIASGLNRPASEEAVRNALEELGTQNIEGILADVSAATDTQQVLPQIEEIPILQLRCSELTFVCSAEASGTRLHLDSLPSDIATMVNPPTRVSDINTIYRNVPLISVEPVTKTARIQVQSDTADIDGVTLERALPNEPSKITLFLNVFDSIDENRCTEGDYSEWGTPAFIKAFRDAVASSRERKAELDESPHNRHTNVLVLDGGFFRFENQSFGDANWAGLVRRDQHSDAASLDGMPEDRIEKTIHGTAVTSIALGGPGLMNINGELGLPITINAMPIYRAEPSGVPGGIDHRLIRDVAGAIDAAEAHIVNMSFGSVNDNDANLRKIKEKFLNKHAPLLIVAAGNLGNNDAPEGRTITSTRIAPQKWGTLDADGGGGFNMIVVAALDPQPAPSKLAWFSNFGDNVVVLGAPGCNIAALRATNEATYVKDSFNGTSFAAPIVSFVAATVRAVMPAGRRTAPWVRARLLATADIEFGVSEGEIESGRVLNPVAAVRVYEDVVTLAEPLGDHGKLLTGQISRMSGSTNLNMISVCETGFDGPHVPLRLFIKPNAGRNNPRAWQMDMITDGDVFHTEPCELRATDPLEILTAKGEVTIRFDMIEDIKFAVHRSTP